MKQRIPKRKGINAELKRGKFIAESKLIYLLKIVLKMAAGEDRAQIGF